MSKYDDDRVHYAEGVASANINRANELQERLDRAIAALKLAKRMNDEALPKFDWGKSCLDANAIDLLNRAPIAVNAALEENGL